MRVEGSRTMQPRIVITGLGMVTSIGMGRTVFWDHLLAGHSGISPVASFDTRTYKGSKGGEVRDFRAADYLVTLDPTRLGRASQFAAAAARLALADAQLDVTMVAAERAGVSMGTTSGEPHEIERFDDHCVAERLDQMGPEFITSYPCHVLPAHVASEVGFAGINTMIPTACAAGNYAVAHAYDVLRSGRADVMLAGGADAFSRITYTGFARLGAIAPDICQPFDRYRKGMIPGEGAAVLVLEPLPRVLERGARIYAEIAGYGLSCDAHHITAAHPAGDGAVRAMQKALHHSGMQPEEVSYISAHGTGTPTNDQRETVAVKRVFKDLAYRIPISSIKSMLGHTMGAASAIEAATCALAIWHNRIPPTMHLMEPDPECDLDYVPNAARDHPVQVAMNNAYAFGGNNSSLLLKKCEA
jgi:3-oxoacyl-[acyl-carrier-protein] synthase II